MSVRRRVLIVQPSVQPDGGGNAVVAGPPPVVNAYSRLANRISRFTVEGMKRNLTLAKTPDWSTIEGAVSAIARVVENPDLQSALRRMLSARSQMFAVRAPHHRVQDARRTVPRELTIRYTG